MLTITLPATFKIGDTVDCRVNKQPARITWRGAATLVVEPKDARTVLCVVVENEDQTFYCADDDAVYEHRVTRDGILEEHTWEGPSGPYSVVCPVWTDAHVA
jgi:hypothetical protein